ncbi:hypothetical protein B0T14DRAFT_514466 [Immersiella caudata]|uniref:Uncharacterized protein n=1 Tax=Immersiella caudata TaxID=314043 RepID=A0AA39WWE8_9PEZI|nr:hypothetical protein B0T14DRAFT_514466 [Immersiella caudata]
MTSEQTQPWKSVWPAPANAPSQAQTQSENISKEEMTNQRSFGSHASNTKGRIVHLKKCMFTSSSSFCSLVGLAPCPSLFSDKLGW